MNNFFYTFKIVIPGQYIDDKKFYQYDDFDVGDVSTPTDVQTQNKGIAYIRYKHVMRTLSEFLVPQYVDIAYATAGTCSTIPTAATITVGFHKVDPFAGSTAYADDAAKYLACAATIKDSIVDAIGTEFSEFLEVQTIVERKLYPEATDTEQFRQLKTEMLTVPAITPTVTVTYEAL